MDSPPSDASTLRPGDPHFTAYVGPPGQYDFMGATQFRLLCSLGLRATHRVLDFGCGSLRAGRFLLTYLDPGGYWGVEPHRWLIAEGLREQLGEEIVRIKRPTFDHNNRFEVEHLNTTFHYVVAQSIFSHTGLDVARRCLRRFTAVLEPRGLIVATFIEGTTDPVCEDWVYPQCVEFRPRTIRSLARDAGLVSCRLPWYHPRQTWYILARERAHLPTRRMRRELRGVVLFDREFDSSWRFSRRQWFLMGRFVRRILPRTMLRALAHRSSSSRTGTKS